MVMKYARTLVGNGAVASVAFGALSLQTLETLELVRSPYWYGSTSSGAAAFLTGWAIYALVVAILSAVLLAIMFVVGRRRMSHWTSTAICLTAVALAAILLSGSRYGLWRPEAALLIAVLAAVAWRSLQNDHKSHWVEVGIAMTALFALAATAHEFTYAIVLLDLGRSLVVYVTMAVGLVTLLYGSYIWSQHREGGKARAIIFRLMAIALIVPAASRVFADFRGLFSAQDEPNVLLVTADTLRADYLSLYGGHVSTPNLDRLGRQGTVFETANSLSSWTPPSFSGLFSSQYPPSTSADSTDAEWRQDVTTGYVGLADYWTSSQGRTWIGDLTQTGVRTAMIQGNVVMMAHDWLVDDFEIAHEIFEKAEQPEGLFRYMPLLHARVKEVWSAAAPTQRFDSSAAARDLTRIHLRQLRHQRFFIWVNFLDPHSPYAPPKRFVPAHVDQRVYPASGAWQQALRPDAQQDSSLAKALYAAEIRYVDECVGNILDQLDRLNLSERTLVCFTSDHGEEFWDHGEWGHGHSLYDELIRIPLIFCGPNIAARRIHTPVSAIDIVPTLAGWTDSAPRAQWRGRNLAAALRSNDAPIPSAPRFAGATFSTSHGAEPFESVSWNRMKLIRGVRTGTQRLYDLDADPAEQRDIAANSPKDVREYTALLDEWNDSFPGRMGDSLPRTQDNVNETDVIDAFKALGYL